MPTSKLIYFTRTIDSSTIMNWISNWVSINLSTNLWSQVLGKVHFKIFYFYFGDIFLVKFFFLDALKLFAKKSPENSESDSSKGKENKTENEPENGI